MSNKTFKLFADKMGGRSASNYIGVEGEIFYDPTTTTLRISNGTTPGGTIFPSTGGGGSSNQLISTQDNNTLSITNDGDVVFSGETGGINRGLVWNYGVAAGGVNSMLRQDQFGLTARAWTETGGQYSAPVRIVTNQDANQKTWQFDGAGVLTLPQGSTINETSTTTVIAPPGAAAGQSLVIRPTASLWTVTSSGNIVYGSPITISINLLNWAYFGTVNYEITGPGVTQQSLGRALTGEVVFTGISEPDTKTVTWTIPANSNITEFTFTLTGVDGTASTGPSQTDPALYYNFEYNALPTGNFVTVTNDGVTNNEASHIHLVAGNPTTVDLYLGDDDQYVKIEKNSGNVVVGTNQNTNNWAFDTNGVLILPGGAAQVAVEDGGVRIGTGAVNTAPSNHIRIGGDHLFEIFGGPPGYSWKFDIDGSLELPTGAGILKNIQTVNTGGSTPIPITGHVVLADSNAADENISLLLPQSPPDGTEVTVKNINSGGYTVFVSASNDSSVPIETEFNTVSASAYASLVTSGNSITWIFDGSAWRIIHKIINGV